VSNHPGRPGSRQILGRALPCTIRSRSRSTAGACASRGGASLARYARTTQHDWGGLPVVHDCSGVYSLDFNALIQAGVISQLVAGAKVYAQYGSRDPHSPSTTGPTDGASFTIFPLTIDRARAPGRAPRPGPFGSGLASQAAAPTHLTPHMLRSTVLVAVALSASALAQSTTRVSVAFNGAEADQYSEAPSISRDGARVAFQSEATNLVSGDTNNAADIFVRDSLLATTVRVSVSSSGEQANGHCSAPVISADGQRVLFLSAATNLVAGDTNGQADLLLRDLAAGVTTRVNVSSAGAQANGISYAGTLSADGRRVAFHSAATNLVAGDTNGFWDIFVHDVPTGVTTRAVVSSSGGQPNGHCAAPSFSGDGRYVAFHSNASNLIAGDTNAAWDAFVRDLQTGVTTSASVSSAGVAANGNSADAVLSEDGRYVVFQSAAHNLVVGDINSFDDVFLRDLQAGLTTRISAGPGGADGDGASRKARISADGRYVAYESLATNLDAGDTNPDWDVLVLDRLSGVTRAASVDGAGAFGDNASNAAAISGDGRYVAFHSYADALVPGDANNTRDVFLRDRSAAAPFAYCTAGTTTLGCVPAIASLGVPSAGASSGFTIRVGALEGARTGLVFYGASGVVDFLWAPGSSSHLCVKSPTQRLQLSSTGGSPGSCSGALAYDFLAFMASSPGALGQPLTPGAAFHAQAWFRDPAAPKSTNLSNALAFAIVP